MKPRWDKKGLERLVDQSKAKETLAERIKQATVKTALQKKMAKREPALLPEIAPGKLTISSVTKPWTGVRAGQASLTLYSRTEEGKTLKTQPWANDIISTLLEAADEGGIWLCLAWPVKFDSLVPLHALASIERNLARDLRGIRTMFYPGTHASRIGLQSILADRIRLSDFYRSCWIQQDGSPQFKDVYTRSPSFEAMLVALNDIRNYHPGVANPSLGEIIPTFLYDPACSAWTTVSKTPLERSISKVQGHSYKQAIREKIRAEWSDPKVAPGALMVLHHTSRKSIWKAALSDTAIQGDGKPGLLLMDATSSADQTNYHAVRRIPEFLQYVRKNGCDNVGAVIITDDPKIFFSLRARTFELSLDPKIRVWAAEGDDAILSPNPAPTGWKPQLRSNANFSVSIVDRDASQVALAFQKLAHSVGNDENPISVKVMAACLYILRLSNLPAGYKDLTDEVVEAETLDFASQRNAWTPVKLGIQEALNSGELNAKRSEVDKAIKKAEKLIDDWSDATPMALRLLGEVRKHAVNSKAGVSIVLPNKKYILLAHRFLRRKLGDQWNLAEPRVDWHTLSSVAKTLSGDRHGRHSVFVGVNRSVLKLILTHSEIQHGTSVLIAYKQAESVSTTLAAMKTVDAFKPYRGRIGLLEQELVKRLKEVPNPIAIGNLGEITMNFRLGESSSSDTRTEQTYYRFDLEGGLHAYASGWLYRYEQDEDPFFRRAAANSIEEGDFIFEMSDALRTKLESVLQLKGEGLGSVVYPERTLLKLYHDDVRSRCDLLFSAKKRSALAREIHAKMVAIEAKAADCSKSRVYYWLQLQSEGDTRPHAPKDAKFFRVFCRALEIDDEQAERNWNFIRNARRLNQNLGRELSARYAEILFQPESAAAYRRISDVVIKQLQQDALSCVFRVERVVAPHKGA